MSIVNVVVVTKISLIWSNQEIVNMKNVMRLDEGFYPIVHYRGDSHGVLTIFCCQHPTHGDLETDFPCVILFEAMRILERVQPLFTSFEFWYFFGFYLIM